MSNDISHRINQIIEHFNLTKSSFSRRIGLSNNVTIGRIVNENRKPSFEIIEKILQTFGSIDANWLLTGNGNMLKTIADEQNIVNDSHASYQTQSNRNFQQLLKEKDKEIDRLMSIIEMLAGNKEPPEGS